MPIRCLVLDLRSGMRRRNFIAGLGGAAAWPLAARAQQLDRPRRIGVLMGFATTDLEAQTFQRAFDQRLHELGWIDGTTATVEYRWGAASAERFKAYAAELVSLKPDIIVANTTPATAALRAATRPFPSCSCRLPIRSAKASSPIWPAREAT